MDWNLRLTSSCNGLPQPELEVLNGAVVRTGNAVGVGTPINDVIYAMLKPFASGAGNG